MPPSHRHSGAPGEASARAGKAMVADPTLVIVRERRPRGLIIAFSIVATLIVVATLVVVFGFDGSGETVRERDPGAVASTDSPVAPGQPGTAAAATHDPAGARGTTPISADGDPSAANDLNPSATADPAGDQLAPVGTEIPASGNADGPEGTDGPAVATIDPNGDQNGADGPAGADGADGPAGADASASQAAGPNNETETETSAPQRASATSVTRPTRPRPAPSYIEVTYDPPTASVVVGGNRQRGGSPVRVGPLRAGSHTIIVSAPGHDPSERTVSVRAGQTQRVNISLIMSQPVMGTVDILSKPIGATARINGRARGQTPLRGIELELGKSHAIELVREGYAPWRATIKPQDDEVTEVKAELVAVRKPEPTPPPTVTKQRDIRVPRDMVGSASRGQRLFNRCQSCHGNSASSLSPRKYTQRQWTRYMASRRHAEHAEFRPLFSVAELADIKSYLLDNAADQQRGTAAGVR